MLLASGLHHAHLQAQVVSNPAPADTGTRQTTSQTDAPLIFRNATPETTEHGVSLQHQSELDAVIKRMHQRVQELARSDLNKPQKQVALDELIRDNHYVLSRHRTWLDWQKPQTVDSASLLLEQMIFDIAADLAPTEQSREQVLENAPQHLDLDPNEAQTGEYFAPPLLAPITASEKKRIQARSTQPKTPASDTDTRALKAAQNEASPEDHSGATVAAEPDKENDGDGSPKVAVLADAKTTADLHDDNTVLRDATDEDGDLVLFGALHLWVGGAIQYDVYAGEGLFTLAQGGDSDSESYIRRGEGVLRASFFDNAEIKAQYDFDAGIFRNLYWRWLSDSSSRSVTFGNQKEPIGLDYLVGNKFNTAMEPSAPSSAFGSYRSMGIRYNGWGSLESEENPLPIRLWGDSRTYVTRSIGLFGEDIENSNDTDWAVTGRVSMGGNKTEMNGFHLSVSASYRQGEYDRIAPRPGIQDANRIILAQPEAETLAQMALEGMYTHGSLHAQAEFYFSDYGGGNVDAQGWGTYGQVGWLFGGKRRHYEPRWGQWAPMDASKEHVLEVFGRVSITHGNDDVTSSNELGLLTIGGNWYYSRLRASINFILADTARDVLDQQDGHSFAARLQYLF